MSTRHPSLTPIASITRRRFLTTAGSLLAAGVCGAWAWEARAADEPFAFLEVNDVHAFDERCGPWLGRAVAQMKAQPEKPEFCLLVGDLSEDGRPEQLATTRDAFRALGVPVYAVPGNHDYRAPDDRKAYDDLYPGRLNYAFEHRGWQFLGLDSTEGQKAENTSIQPATLRWVDDTLPKLDRQRPLVVFTHFPLGPLTPMRSTNADALLARFEKHHLVAVYNGHFHGFTERHLGRVTLTTDRCCSFHRANHDGTKEKGYFVCRAKGGQIARTFVEVKG